MSAAAWAWIGLGALIAAYVLGFDLAFPEHTLSAQFHQWMQNQVTGPIVVGLWVGVSTGFIYHFLIT